MKIIVSTSQVAAVLGISSQALLKKAKKQNWPVTGIRVQGGGDTYDLDEIPVTARNKQKLRRKIAAMLKKNEPLLESIDLLEEQKQALIDAHQVKLKEINRQLSRIKKRLNNTATTTIEELFT